MEIPVTVIAEAPFKEALLIHVGSQGMGGLVVLEDGHFEYFNFPDLKAHWTYDPELRRWRAGVESEAAMIEALQEEVRVLKLEMEELYAYVRELEDAQAKEPEAEQEEETW